jgi:glycosyltransferase involved in cell wall biosynthesis
MLITHDRPAFIPEAIDSVLSQSFTDWELVVVDNGSTDQKVGEILRNYEIKDTRVKFYPQSLSVDIPTVRNTALDFCSGEYLAIIDSDDIWHDQDKLTKQVKFLDKNHDYVLVGSGVIVIGEKGQEKKRYLNPETDKEIRKIILFRNPVAHSSVVFRMIAVKEIDGYNPDLKIGEDYDLSLRLGQEKKMYNFPEYFIKYRVHSNGVCSQNMVLALKNNLKIIKKYKSFYPNYITAMMRRKIRLFAFQCLSLFSTTASQKSEDGVTL